MGAIPDLSAGYVRLVHWNEAEVAERATMLEAEGYEVDGTVPGTSIGLRALAANPPIALVIDLGRLPSQGREVGRAVRGSKSLRSLPLVFVAGAPAKVAQAESEFPDAVFCGWELIGQALEAAIANPPAEPVVPKADIGPRSATPLVEKLGIREGDSVAVIDAPDGFGDTLGALPSGARILDEGSAASMLLWFVSESSGFERRLGGIAEEAGEGTLWVAWPKASSPLATDLREGAIRDAALSIGLVDTKVCAIDDDWSGLRLTRRRSS